MAQYITKKEFLERIHTARQQWETALAEVSPETALQPSFCGNWSLAELIAHLNWYEQEITGVLEQRRFSGSPLWDLPLDQRNEIIRQQTAPGSLAEKMAEECQTFERLMAAIDGLDEKDLNDPAAFPGMPLDWEPWQILADNITLHYKDHLPELEKHFNPPRHRFHAVIEDPGGGGAYVTIPFDVEQVFGKKRVKILATIDGEPYRGTLVRMGTPCHMLLILKEIRQKIGKSFGEQVEVTLEEDNVPREVKLPPDLLAALEASPEASAFFQQLSYTHQKEYVQWIEEAKQAATRQRRLEKTIQMLLEGRRSH
ncbi:MAG: YdeI/OmpD-associated family protein [Anaerolineales bacterium]|jgi:uncharacterized damage-inducible protein DinB|nr:YdeI/OmpD-associated family protein [Anaerolineales bacterium]